MNELLKFRSDYFDSMIFLDFANLSFFIGVMINITVINIIILLLALLQFCLKNLKRSDYCLKLKLNFCM